MTYLTCLTARVAIVGVIYALFHRQWFRSVTETGCVLLLLRLVFLYSTFQAGQQRASVNMDLVVTWNSLRPMHMLTLAVLAYASRYNEKGLAFASAAMDVAISALVHVPITY